LKTQLDDLVDEVKNINDNNEMIKNKCEEKLKWYREKLNTRVQHYKKLPKVQNIEKINQNIEDSECSNAKLQKEITNIKSEIGSMIKDTGLKYGSVVDWGVALASSMIKMKNSRRNYCEREERIKKLETRMNELEQKKNSIMEKQKIENENFTCKKITKGCSLIDSKIMKSSEMKSPLTLFDDFFKYSFKSSSKKREIEKSSKEETDAKKQKSSIKLGSSGLKLNGNMPNFFSCLQNQMEKAGNNLFRNSKNNCNDSLKKQTMKHLYKPVLPKVVELSSEKSFIKPNLKKAQSEIFSSNKESKKVTFPELSKRCKSYKSVHAFSKFSDSVFEKEIVSFNEKNVRSKFSDEINVREDEKLKEIATEEVQDSSLDRSFIEGEIIDSQPSQKTIEEAMDLGVEITQIVDDFNEDAVPQAPPPSQSNFEPIDDKNVHQLQSSNVGSPKLSQENSVPSSQNIQHSQTPEFMKERIELVNKSDDINKNSINQNSPVDVEFKQPLAPYIKKSNQFVVKDGEFVVPAPPKNKLKPFVEDPSCQSSHQTSVFAQFFDDSSSSSEQQNDESSGFASLFSASGPDQMTDNVENFSTLNFIAPTEDLNKSANFSFDFTNQKDTSRHEGELEFAGMFNTSNEEKSKGEDLNFQQIFGSNVEDANISNDKSINFNFGTENTEDQTDDENALIKLF